MIPAGNRPPLLPSVTNHSGDAQASDAPEHEQDEDDDEHQPEDARRAITPAARIALGRQCADQQQDDDNEEDRAEAHEEIPSYRLRIHHKPLNSNCVPATRNRDRPDRDLSSQHV